MGKLQFSGVAISGLPSVLIVVGASPFFSLYLIQLAQCIVGVENVLLPEKGAAVLFYSLYSSGLRDLHSWHGGCPVMKGSKWIFNKWMCMYDNFKKFPCQLSPKMRFIPPSHQN